MLSDELKAQISNEVNPTSFTTHHVETATCLLPEHL
jgi:hypothetical protein